MEISKIAKTRHKAEDLDYKKILKHYLPTPYGEFKNIFFKK